MSPHFSQTLIKIVYKLYSGRPGNTSYASIQLITYATFFGQKLIQNLVKIIHLTNFYQIIQKSFFYGDHMFIVTNVAIVSQPDINLPTQTASSVSYNLQSTVKLLHPVFQLLLTSVSHCHIRCM